MTLFLHVAALQMLKNSNLKNTYSHPTTLLPPLLSTTPHQTTAHHIKLDIQNAPTSSPGSFFPLRNSEGGTCEILSSLSIYSWHGIMFGASSIDFIIITAFLTWSGWKNTPSRFGFDRSFKLRACSSFSFFSIL